MCRKLGLFSLVLVPCDGRWMRGRLCTNQKPETVPRCHVIAFAACGAAKRANHDLLARSDHHDHLPSLQLRHDLNLACQTDRLCNPVENGEAKILVSHFTSPESHRNLDLVPVREKPHHVAHLDVEVMAVSVRTKLDLFDLDGFLLFSGFRFPFLPFVLELSVVHDLANGRAGGRRNFDKVQARLVREFNSSFGMNNSDVLTVGTNKSNFRGDYAFVYAGTGVALRWRVVGASCYWIRVLCCYCALNNMH